jgi:hypothetical protein
MTINSGQPAHTVHGFSRFELVEREVRQSGNLEISWVEWKRS